MHDINDPSYYEAKDKETLAHQLHNAGLHNLGQLVKSLFEQVEELEKEVEEGKEASYEDGYESGCSAGYDSAMEDYESNSANKIREFTRWYLKEFEPEKAEKIKFKTIGGRTFVIMSHDDYAELKSEFHRQLD